MQDVMEFRCLETTYLNFPMRCDVCQNQVFLVTGGSFVYKNTKIAVSPIYRYKNTDVGKFFCDTCLKSKIEELFLDQKIPKKVALIQRKWKSVLSIPRNDFVDKYMEKFS